MGPIELSDWGEKQRKIAEETPDSWTEVNRIDFGTGPDYSKFL